MIPFLIIPLLATAFYRTSNQLQTYLMLIAYVIQISWWVGKKTHWTAGLAFSYFNIMGLLYLGLPLYYWGGMDPGLMATLESLIAESIIYLSFPVIVILSLNEDRFFEMEWLVLMLAVIDALVMLGKFAVGYQPFFLLNNSAVDASFVACCIPLMMRSKYYNISFIMILACIVSKSSSGILGVGIGLSAYYLASKKFALKSIIKATTISSMVAIIGYLMQGKILFNSSGRYDVWKLAISQWWSHCNHWIGTGLGTFFLYGPSIQMDRVVSNGGRQFEAFFWMHNDWLQILFETGFIGLGLTLAIIAVAVARSCRAPALFAAIVTYGSLAVIQMPLRHIIFAILGILLISMALIKQDTNCQNSAQNIK